VKQLQAFRELRPTGGQRARCAVLPAAARFVFNKALSLQQDRYQGGQKKLGYAGLCKLLTQWRNSPEPASLADAPVHPLQQTLKNLERAYGKRVLSRSGGNRLSRFGGFLGRTPQQRAKHLHRLVRAAG